MGDWRNNPANNFLTGGGGEWYDSPIAQDMLMRQKLIAQGVPPEQIDQIMAQIKQAESLKEKIAMAEGLPIGSSDTLSALDNEAVPIAEPEIPQVVDGGAPAAGAGTAASTSPSSAPAAGSTESIYDRLGPEGLEMLLNQGSIDDQMAQAQYLRNKEGPKGLSGIGKHNSYVAANPLSHLVSGIEKYRAKKDIKRLREEEKEGNRTIIDLLRGAISDDDEEDDAGFRIGRGP